MHVVEYEHLKLQTGDSKPTLNRVQYIEDNMSHDVRKPVFMVCKQQRRRPACASAQTDQHLCYSQFGKYHI